LFICFHSFILCFRELKSLKLKQISNFLLDSRSGTPQNLSSRKSPTSDMGNQRGDGQGGKDKPQRNQQQRNNNQQQRERRDSGRNEGQENNKGGYRVSWSAIDGFLEFLKMLA
jgi:hypothetical protein